MEKKKLGKDVREGWLKMVEYREESKWVVCKKSMNKFCIYKPD